MPDSALKSDLLPPPEAPTSVVSKSSPKKDLPRLSDIPRQAGVVSLRGKLFPDGSASATVLNFVIREEIFALLESQTENIAPDVLRQLAHSIRRNEAGGLEYVLPHIHAINWRLTTLLSEGLGMQTVPEEQSLINHQPDSAGLLLDVHSIKPLPQGPKIPQGPSIYQSHYFHLDALLMRLLKMDEHGQRLDRPDADTFVLRIDDQTYSTLMQTHLDLNLIDCFYNAPDVADLKSEASHAMSPVGKRKKSIWDETLRELETFCQKRVKKTQTSVIYVPADTFYSYERISFDNTIPNRYAAAIALARKNGHTILLVTQKPISAHKNFFHSTGVFFKQLFGDDNLGEHDPNVVHFSPSSAENNRVHHLQILHLLYQFLAEDIKTEIATSREKIAGLPLFEEAFLSPTMQLDREREVLRRVNFLKELALILSLRDKSPHSFPHVGESKSELEKLLDLIRTVGFKWDKSVFAFMKNDMKNPYNNNNKALKQRLWEQFCLFCHQGSDSEIPNALERSKEKVSDSIGDQDTLRLAFEYYLAKMIYDEGWSMPGIEGLTQWTRDMYGGFVRAHAGKEFLDVSFAAEVFPHPGPYTDKTGAIILDPQQLAH